MGARKSFKVQKTSGKYLFLALIFETIYWASFMFLLCLQLKNCKICLAKQMSFHQVDWFCFLSSFKLSFMIKYALEKKDEFIRLALLTDECIIAMICCTNPGKFRSIDCAQISCDIIKIISVSTSQSFEQTRSASIAVYELTELNRNIRKKLFHDILIFLQASYFPKIELQAFSTPHWSFYLLVQRTEQN